ncbi:MAG: PadR family transcriptional regulator [Phycisphaeraceae bacterium]|nr:PadR family transcriptional regulator [Phycisphaeraceae bacterium]
MSHTDWARPALLQGTMDVLALAVLAHGPRHGYAIAREIERVSNGALTIEEGTLYPALKRLAKRGDLAWEWRPTATGRRGRTYRLTDAGRRRLAEQSALWRTFSGAVARVLEFGGPAFAGADLSIEITE